MTPIQEANLQKLAKGEPSSVPVHHSGEVVLYRDWHPPKAIQALAQVVLELAENSHPPVDIRAVVREEIDPANWLATASATATDYVGVVTAAASCAALDNTGSLDIRVLADGEEALLAQPRKILRLEPNGPISAEELKRRGVDDELDARAIDVVMRCGWPRDGDPLGIRPCVPVPVATLVSWSRDIAKNGPRVEDEIDAVLRDQTRIKGLYLETAEEKNTVEQLPEVPERQWRCVECKRVTTAAVEPARCVECGCPHFAELAAIPRGR